MPRKSSEFQVKSTLGDQGMGREDDPKDAAGFAHLAQRDRSETLALRST